MHETIQYLLENSRLPGKRGNLELLYSFSKQAKEDEIKACLAMNEETLKNCPEEFVVMCGILGLSVQNKEQAVQVLTQIEPYATHGSWRIREAVAMSIQEIILEMPSEVMHILKSWSAEHPLKMRAVSAGLCEPKVLKNEWIADETLALLEQMTKTFDRQVTKLTEDEKALRKALGYCWSVAIVASPEKGKKAFEKLIENNNKNIQWIVKNNLKKKRLERMDKVWLDNVLNRL